MPEPVKHQVTEEDAQRIREEDFQRAAARRLEIEARRAADPDYHPHDPPVPDIPAWAMQPGQMVELPPRAHRILGGKAGEIIDHLHDDEPVFVFRAQDILSVFALEAYAELIEKYDGQGKQAMSLSHAIQDFRYWQKANPQWVKLPD